MSIAKGMGLGLLVVAVAGGGATAWLRRSGDVKARLVRDITAAYARPAPSVSPGGAAGPSFRALVEPVMPELLQAVDAKNALSDVVREEGDRVRKGEEAFRRLPPEWLSLLDSHHAAVQTALRATRAEARELPPGISTLEADFWSPHGPGNLPLQYAVSAGTLELWRSLSPETPQQSPGADGVSPVDWAAAVDDCLDLLGMARVLGESRGMLGLMLEKSVVRIASPACASVVSGAPNSEKSRAQARLLALRDALPSFDDALADETVFAELAYAPSILSGDEMAGLPPEAVRFAAAHPVKPAWWRRVFAAEQLRYVFRERDALRATSTLPPDARGRALRELSAHAEASFDPSRRDASIAAARFYDTSRQTFAILEALAGGAYGGRFFSEHQRWPSKAEVVQALALRTEDLLEFEGDDEGKTFAVGVMSGDAPLSFDFTAP